MRRLLLLLTILGLSVPAARDGGWTGAGPADGEAAETAGTIPAEERVLRRGEFYETVAEKGAARRLTVYARRKFYVAAGGYERVRTAAVPDSGAGFSRAVHAGPYVYRFDPRDAGRGSRFERGKHHVTFRPRGDRTGAASTVRFTGEGVKETIVLSPGARPVLEWDVETDAEAVFAGGELRFTAPGGAFLFRVPRPRARDAGGALLGVGVDFRDGVLTYTVDVPADAAWPVTVDPTVTTGEEDPSSGALFSHDPSYYTARNSGTADSTDVSSLDVRQRWDAVNHCVGRTALLFDTSSIPDNAEADSAEVVLVVDSKAVSTNSDFDLYLVEGTFSGSFGTDWFNDFAGWAPSGVYPVTALAPTKNTSAMSSGDTLRFKLNATGLEKIDRAGGTKYMLLASTDINADPPVGNEVLWLEDDSPYMRVWFEEPPVRAPSNFVMTALDTASIACSWVDESDNEEAFHIIDWSDSTVIATLPADATADTISGLNVNEKHVWAVVADSAGVKGYSFPDSAYTMLPAPGPRDIELMPISSDTLRVSAKTPPNPDAGGTGMEVYAVSGSGADGSGRLEGTYVYLDGGLNPDSTYVYKVRYRNGDGVPTGWSPELTYAMNGVDTLVVYLGGDGRDDYNVDFGPGRADSTVVRAGASDTGEKLDGFLSFELPWQVQKGGVDSLFLTMRRISEGSSGSPALTLYGIPAEDVAPVETLDLGAQDSTAVKVGWTVAAGEGERTTPNLRDIFRAWQDLAARKDYPHGFGLRLDDGGQADGVRAVFLDASHPSYDCDTKLTIYYTPGEPDTLDGSPADFTMTVLGPDSLRAEWSDNSTTEYGFVLCDAADSTAVAGVDTLDADTVSVTVGGLTPNTLYRWFVRAFTACDDSSSAADGKRTPARTPGFTSVTPLTDTSVVFVIDPRDNPSWTEFAVQDSVTGMYVDAAAEPDTLRPGPPGEWGWRTYSEWGAASGDTLAGLRPDSLYVIRAKARTEE